MKKTRRTILPPTGGTPLADALPGSGHAQPGPARELRIVVGFPPDGPLDIVARTIAPALERGLGRPVRVENHVGAGGNDAARLVVRAAPDGGTVLLCAPLNAINATLIPDLDFDFGHDILPVAGIARLPIVIEVHPSVPARSIPGLIDHARANPGRLRVAYAGTGTPQHMAIELFQHLADVRFSLVAYRGSAAALDDLLRGAADVMFDPAPSSLPHVRAGRLVPLATTGPSRAPVLPELPIVADILAGYEAGSWFGLGVPRGTSAEAVARLNAAVNAGLRDAGIRQALARLGAEAMPGTAAEFGRFVAAETARYAEIIRVARSLPT
ncbi:Bug family tripartite tricarboxylate transporter substrate binding protein [Stella sp.]|uniref:Bug family tripartite tricarboxylate transporter substrate binding protein n=1 Tax=Stella sp. TaxID=2912054 RepID=UPI0035B00EDC